MQWWIQADVWHVVSVRIPALNMPFPSGMAVMRRLIKVSVLAVDYVGKIVLWDVSHSLSGRKDNNA